MLLIRLASLLAACSAAVEEETPRVTCPGGEVDDGGSCVPEACGVGTWGNIPVDGETVFVDTSAASGGDGSETAPLASIQAAVDLAGDRGGGLVALAGGLYGEVVAMGDDHRGVTLTGRCRELVTIDGSNGDDEPTIGVVGEDRRPEVSIAGVTVTGGTSTGLWFEQARVTMATSDVRDNTLAGILAYGADVDLDEVGVYGTVPDPRGDYGWGIDAQSGSQLTATACALAGNTFAGILVTNAGTVASLADSDMSGTLPTPSGNLGSGIMVTDGATATVSGSTVASNGVAGVLVDGVGSSLALEETTVSDTLGTVGASGGVGAYAIGGGTLTLDGCTLQENLNGALYVANAGTVVALADTALIGMASEPEQSSARGVQVSDGAMVTVTSCSIQGSTTVGVLATDPGTSVVMSDVDVLDTTASADGSGGDGLFVENGAALSASRCLLQRNAGSGAYVGDPGTLVDLTETEILDTSARVDGTTGGALLVAAGAALTAAELSLRNNAAGGLLAWGAGTMVQLQDTEILDTLPNADGIGRGVEVGEGAALTATRCTIERSTDVGLVASDAGTLVDLVDSAILDTQPRPDGTFGRGVAALGGASITATRCSIERNTEGGLCADDEGTAVTLIDTEVLDTLPSPSGQGGRGIWVQSGAELDATGCTIMGNTEVGVGASVGSATRVDLVDAVVSDTHRGRVSGVGVGVAAQFDVNIGVTDSEISGTEGPGAYVSEATLDLEGVLVAGNTYAGALVAGGAAYITGSTISDTLTDPEWGGGFGLYSGNIFGTSTITLTGSTIDGADYAALWLDGDGAFDIEGNTLSGSTGIDQGGYALHGNAVFAERGVTAWNGVAGLLLQDNTFTGSSETSVLLDASSASLVGNAWSENGVDVRQQVCGGVTDLTDAEPDWDPGWIICPAGNVLTAYDLSFTTLTLPATGTEG